MPSNLQGHRVAAHPFIAQKEAVYTILCSVPTEIPCCVVCPHVHMLTQVPASPLPMETTKPCWEWAGACKDYCKLIPKPRAVLQGLRGA